MKISAKVMAIIVVVALVGGISVSFAAGWWKTKGGKTPATFSEGRYAGAYNPADIRGSYTFGDVSQLFEIPMQDLQKAFRLPAESPELLRLNVLEEAYGYLGLDVGTSSIKLFTSFYRNLPYDTSLEDTWLLPEGTALLKEKADLTTEQIAYLDSHTVAEELIVSGIEASSLEPADAAEEHASSSTPGLIEGKTTFQDLLDWGVAQEDIEKALDEDMPAGSVIIKDWVSAKGLSFGTIKAALQALIDALP